MRISFKVKDTQVQKAMSKLLNGVTDFSEPLRRSSERLMPYFSETVFESQGSVLGESWRALAESTLRARAKRSGYYRAPPIASGKILIWTGRLQKGFKSAVTSTTLTISNPVPYFRYHQMSQRRMLAVNQTVITITMAEMHRYAQKLLT